jgi:hypothetical protein
MVTLRSDRFHTLATTFAVENKTLLRKALRQCTLVVPHNSLGGKSLLRTQPQLVIWFVFLKPTFVDCTEAATRTYVHFRESFSPLLPATKP